jgi:predicted O-methyltransferase YrrM
MSAVTESPVPCLQSAVEMKWLVEHYRLLEPSRILEVGSLYGGTLWHWVVNSKPGSTIVSVDLILDSQHFPKSDVLKSRQLWDSWAEEAEVDLHAFVGDSRSSEILALVSAYLPYDFIFIDGNHKRKVLERDFKNYWPMLNKGGLMAFHDIAYDLDNPHCLEVGRWWNDIKASGRYKTDEIIEKRGFRGIGVIHKTVQ